MNQDLQNLEIKVENEGTTPQGRLTAMEWNILVAAVKSLDLTGGSADVTSILQAVANAGYATQEWVNNQGYATATDFNKFVKDFVTLDTTQAISGIKDFTNGLKIGGLYAYKSQDDTIYLDANLVVRGGVTAFGTNETITASIFEALPIDGVTLKRTENGVLYVASGGSGGTGGGISIADVENYLTTNGYATQSWVTGKGYFLASNFTKANIKSALGISDWALASAKPTYTASEVGALMQDSSTTNADLDTILDSETAVLKPFFQVITGTNIGSARKGVLRMSYNGSESQLLFDHYNRLLRYRTIGGNPKDWATIAFTSDIPTKLSQLTDDVVSGKYLSLAGGTISQSAYWSTKFKSTGQTSSAIAFEVANGNVGYLMYADGSKWQVTAQNWSATHTLLHSGNYSNYALPITGGTVNGDISLPNGNRLISPSGNIAGTRIFGDDTTNYRTILGTASLNTLLIGNSTLKFWKGTVSKEYEIIDTSMPSISFPRYIATGIGTTEQSGYKVTGNGVDVTFGAKDATGGAYIWVASNHALRLGTNGAERVRITAEGLVGIGNTNPVARLDVGGTILTTADLATTEWVSDRGQIKANCKGTSYWIGIGATSTGQAVIQGGNRGVGSIPLLLNPTAGNVAIGGTTASEKLHVYGNILATGAANVGSLSVGSLTAITNYQNAALVIGSSGATTYINGATQYIRYGATLQYYAQFKNNGDIFFPYGWIGIGTTVPSEKLTVAGNILATGGITAQNSSDRRLKRNLRKFNASKVLMSLGAVWEYEYIDSEVEKNHIYEGTHYGLIYQYVKGSKLDVMCHEREDGFGTLNYIHPKFISLIAGATMENISEVEKLKRKIRHLEAKVKQLEKRA